MKDESFENERTERILAKARLSEASPELKRQITAEARNVWHQTSQDIPWQIPLRRLVASAAAAVLIIWLTNFVSDYALTQSRSDGPSVAGQRFTTFDMVPEMPYGSFVRHLASVDRRSQLMDASALSDYIENVRKVLNETVVNGVSAPAVERGGTSRLVPDRVNTLSYS